jgi:nucleoside-diphosphate-sugar epimerase
MPEQTVLVTGGSGFIAGHCIIQLLDRGYRVHATIRSLQKQAAVRQVLADAGATNLGNLDFVAADLMDDTGWAEAMTGLDYVLHVASPVHPGPVEDEQTLIRPAREGALRVLKAARDAGVRRVVLTSAFHAVGWGHKHDGHVFTEADWTILDGAGVDAYGRSKTLAERAAWEFIEREGGTTELATILPVAVMGPVMGKEISGSNHVIERMLNGRMPLMPDLYFPIVDVRDVARAHVEAMVRPEAAGERFIISNGEAMPLKDIASILRETLGEKASHVPTRTIPSLVLRLIARFRPELRAALPDLGYARKASNDKARRLLGLQPLPAREAIIAAGQSMVSKGLVP